jgi:hypothetical protein
MTLICWRICQADGEQQVWKAKVEKQLADQDRYFSLITTLPWVAV